ncbi:MULTISPECIES: recombinase family protein [Rahnella]|uniref:recombinase family protein n=1 Tax=Rahnella TaxID=34037 RepID=UPI001AD89A5B|nr:recombinase family protein [Rahnella sp. ChDrAdgB13]
MYIFGYLRASTKSQDAKRAQKRMKAFAEDNGHRVAAWYIENESGASLQRPELMRMLDDADTGDVILIEQVDRLSRLSEDDWGALKTIINAKQLAVVSLDLPTSQMALTDKSGNDFQGAMLRAINGMMLDMLAAISRKDYEDRRRRQREGIDKAKAEGKFHGRRADEDLHMVIMTLRKSGKSLADVSRISGASLSTVNRVCKKLREEAE